MKTVPLHGAKAAGRVALVDDEDYELAMQYRWNVHENVLPSGRMHGPYAVTKWNRGGKQGALYLHCLIAGRRHVDHADHDGLNNQRSNLRPATQSQNNANRRKSGGCSSQFKGVNWQSQIRKWRAQIKVDGQYRCLGYFASETEAAAAYDAAALETWGEFALLNLPPAKQELAEKRKA